jgi:hypothetical protein
MILPDAAPRPIRTQGRAMQVRKSPGGIIIPEGVAA